MSTGIRIEYREASDADIDQLVALRIRQLVDEGYPETADINRHLSDYFSASMENGSLLCWVGVVDEVVVATAAICFYQLPPTFSNPSGRVAYLTNMYTDDACRRRGVASHLLRLLLERAKAMEYTSIRLHASRHGKGIYEKAGFTDSDGFMDIRL